MRLKGFLGSRRNNILFICQMNAGYIKVIKCLSRNSHKEFLDPETIDLPIQITREEIEERIRRTFQELGYCHDSIIVALPGNLASTRCLKLNTKNPLEIEKALFLEAGHFMPAAADELTIGYQIISVDQQSRSHLYAVISREKIIRDILGALYRLSPRGVDIMPASYGLCNLYNYLDSNSPGPVIIADIDSNYVESAIIADRKLIFSRFFKLNDSRVSWQDIFVQEIKRIKLFYSQEAGSAALDQIIITGRKDKFQELEAALNKEKDLSFRYLDCIEKLGLRESSSIDSPSFTALFGLGLSVVSETLNLLPRDIKEKSRRKSVLKKYIRFGVLTFAVLLIYLFSALKSLDNKKRYLGILELELNKLAVQAGPIYAITRHPVADKAKDLSSAQIAGILYELHNLLPPQSSLTSFVYEKDKQIVLRGRTLDIDSVFTLIVKLKDTEVMREFNIGLRYLAQKNTAQGRFADFEIYGVKK